MYKLVRTASLELQLINNKEVVKVAGILNKLKNYLKQLGDREYADAVDTLRSDSWMLQQIASQLRKKIKELTEAIDDGDITNYDLALEEVRNLTTELATELKQLNQDAQQSDPRVQDPNVPLNPTPTSVQTQASETSINLESDKYTREQWDDPNKRAAIFAYTDKMIKEWHPNHDVPLQKNINKPIHDFAWFKDKDIHIKQGNESGAKDRLIDQTAKLLVRETSLPYEEARATFENDGTFNEFARRLVNAIYNGTLLHYFPATPMSEPKDKSKPWVKERQIGEVVATVKTADFTIPVYDVVVHMTVGLIDMGTPLNGTNKLVLGFTEYPRVLAHGVPPALRKGFPSKSQELTPKPIVPEPSPIPEPESPELAEPIKRKVVRKKAVSALRIEFLKNLLSTGTVNFRKNAGINPNAAKGLPDSFWIKFVEMSNRLGAKPEDLAQVIYSESGFDPHATNVQEGRIIAKGLNQLVEKTAKILGMTDQEWRSYENSPAEAQLKYVEKFFKNVGQATGQHGKWKSATQLYVANFAPKYVRQAANPNTVLYSAQEHKEQYEKNKGLDRDKKGTITAGDLERTVQGKKLPDFIKQAIDRAKTGLPSSNLSYVAMDNRPANDNIDSLLTTLFALDAGPVERIVRHALERKMLPMSKVLITISSLSSPYPVRIKFAHTVSNLLKEMIDADVTCHSDGKKIELQCNAAGSEYAVASAVKGLCDCVVKATEFKLNIGVRCAVLPSIISKYAEVNNEM